MHVSRTGTPHPSFPPALTPPQYMSLPAVDTTRFSRMHCLRASGLVCTILEYYGTYTSTPHN